MADKYTIKESSQDEARLTDTGRTAALSDGVFAITITLLVLEIARPEGYKPGGLLYALLENWLSYLAYAVPFFGFLHEDFGTLPISHNRHFILARILRLLGPWKVARLRPGSFSAFMWPARARRACR